MKETKDFGPRGQTEEQSFQLFDLASCLTFSAVAHPHDRFLCQSPSLSSSPNHFHSL